MATYELRNDVISIAVDSHGAEQKSLKRLSDGREYLWCADPAFWGRTAPILFPVVGGVNNKEIRTKGQTYPMNQHGFARDMEFDFVEQKENEIWFELKSDEETLKKYPYAFSLTIGYILDGYTVKVVWKVENPADEDLPFSIGGHPAFNCPINAGDKRSDYFIRMDAEHIVSTDLEGGLASPVHQTEYDLPGGYLPVTVELFDKDALILEHDQAKKVSLCTPDRKPYLTVDMEASIFGVWSPVGKEAGFVCIEPWYGRCDKNDFTGELKDREWGNVIAPNEVFEKSFTITIYELS